MSKLSELIDALADEAKRIEYFGGPHKSVDYDSIAREIQAALDADVALLRLMDKDDEDNNRRRDGGLGDAADYLSGREDRMDEIREAAK